jgi:hypothetical protein
LVRVLDSLDALAAVAAFILILVLVATGRVPRDLELLAYGLGGALLVAAVVVTIWKRKR